MAGSDDIAPAGKGPSAGSATLSPKAAIPDPAIVVLALAAVAGALIGIPLIAISLPLFVAAFFAQGLWPLPVAMFVIGWALQFVGHWFEGKPPEFFRDWRFLFVGLRWWMAKMSGRV